MADEKRLRSELLELYKDLRVADVRDGMDWNLMHGFGTMTAEIRPVWRTRAVGIAHTCRYLPFQGPVPPLTSAEYGRWSTWYYQNVCTYPWMQLINDGDFIVIDASGVDAGLIGSANGLSARNRGARGIVTSGAVRDSDELVLERVPVWSAGISQSMIQGRLAFDAMDVPVAVGGVAVRPGDVIVADGDGVIVVPASLARDVARFAHQELSADKVERRKLYGEAGLAPDGSLE